MKAVKTSVVKSVIVTSLFIAFSTGLAQASGKSDELPDHYVIESEQGTKLGSTGKPGLAYQISMETSREFCGNEGKGLKDTGKEAIQSKCNSR